MLATLIASMFAGAALLAAGAMISSWRKFGFRFRELRAELRTAHDPQTARYTWRETGARPSAIVYSLDFKAKADGLPFHPELSPELRAAA